MEDTPARKETHAFIRFSTDAKYTEHVAAMDAECGYPSGGTTTSHPPIELAPRTSRGKPMIAVKWRDMADKWDEVEDGIIFVQEKPLAEPELVTKELTTLRTAVEVVEEPVKVEEVMTYKKVLRPNVTRDLYKRASSKTLTGPQMALRKEWVVETDA